MNRKINHIYAYSNLRDDVNDSYACRLMFDGNIILSSNGNVIIPFEKCIINKIIKHTNNIIINFHTEKLEGKDDTEVPYELYNETNQDCTYDYNGSV